MHRCAQVHSGTAVCAAEDRRLLWVHARSRRHEEGGPMSVPVYDQLRGLILSQEIGPDTILVETALAARLGVSRTPIREALRRLEQDGLIERTSRGTRVVERSPE